MNAHWVEVGDGVLVRRYAELDLCVGLVLGAEKALVVDTRGDHRQGIELATAVRHVTSLPCQVAITHGHFDHCFGTGAFPQATVWAHAGCPAFLGRTAEDQRREWVEHYRASGRTEIASALATTEPVIPNALIRRRVDLDLGARHVRLLHPGLGHTDHDLVVVVPDADVTFAGDLVEHGAPPSFEDSYPTEWPTTVDHLLAVSRGTIVPGHGDVVDAAFVAAQRDELRVVAELCRAVTSGELHTTEALLSSPYPADVTRSALARTHRDTNGSGD